MSEVQNHIIKTKTLMRSKKHDTLSEALENSVCVEVGFHAEEAFYLDRAIELLEKAGWIYGGE